MPRCWLMKSEPGTYSIADLERDGRTPWEGVRNYLARNRMREMRTGDLVVFYHSSATPPGAAGLARVVREAYPDPTALDPESPYFDPDSRTEAPRWWRVDVEFVERFPDLVPLADLKAEPGLAAMEVTRRSRASVQPVRPEELEIVRRLATERA
ncbi:MAG: EVE domain-containing protein [Gemmatimonadota bacterium]|nr:EVE domain-containing protein [Gemmatimonadota bacterium]